MECERPIYNVVKNMPPVALAQEVKEDLDEDLER